VPNAFHKLQDNQATQHLDSMIASSIVIQLPCRFRQWHRIIDWCHLWF